MSQPQKNSIQALREETELLRAQVEKLQQRLQVKQKAALEPAEDENDVWNVWPYSWAQSGWATTAFFCEKRFHWLHGKLSFWLLARRNQKIRLEFSRQAQPTGLELV